MSRSEYWICCAYFFALSFITPWAILGATCVWALHIYLMRNQ